MGILLAFFYILKNTLWPTIKSIPKVLKNTLWPTIKSIPKVEARQPIRPIIHYEN